ncbi:MAG TPA: hypothetical protein EYO33_00650 [Phycisphaerales bacterium]|nr:hypothetical protein [Phycisphaerales bacterium]
MDNGDYRSIMTLVTWEVLGDGLAAVRLVMSTDEDAAVSAIDFDSNTQIGWAQDTVDPITGSVVSQPSVVLTPGRYIGGDLFITNLGVGATNYIIHMVRQTISGPAALVSLIKEKAQSLS